MTIPNPSPMTLPSELNQGRETYWSKAEVASMFDVSKRTVSRWVSQGRFDPVWRSGNNLRILGSSIERFIEAGLVSHSDDSDTVATTEPIAS